MRKRKDKPDIYDIRNCPFHLNYWTRCLIEDHLITVYDNDIFLFNQMFDEVTDLDFELVQRCFRYTRDYCNRNKRISTGCSVSLGLRSTRTSERWMDTMKGWKSGMKKQAPTLEQFARIVRTNRSRLKRLYDDLAYARYLMYAAQGDQLR